MLINFTHPGDVVTDLEVNANSKGKSLTRLAIKKAKMRVVKQSSHKKGKFSIESSLQTSPKNEEFVTTTSFKKGGKTYEISSDSIGRTREVSLNKNDECHSCAQVTNKASFLVCHERVRSGHL